MAMPVTVSQKEYLKKYLSGEKKDKKDKKKKKKDRTKTNKGLTLVEDSCDIKEIPFGYFEEDDAPTIAEITYENEKVRDIEDFKAHSKKWKNINDRHSTGTLKNVDSSILNNSTCKTYDNVIFPKHSNISPIRRKRHDSDTSPVRQIGHDSNASIQNRTRHGSDSSPPRRKRHDSDASPPRRARHDSDSSPPRRKRHDSDASPPRKTRQDSDSSPPRRKRHDSDASPPRSKGPGLKNGTRQDKIRTTQIDSRPEKKMTTQEYLKARKFGRLKKDTPEDLRRKETEALMQKEAENKYKDWNKGIVQKQRKEEKIAETVHEMGKSFARAADDTDMNERLKGIMREEDPMLQYVLKKKGRDDGEKPLKPIYRGSFPPNRFQIRPGYRWDGVDRSSGFERDWFNKQNSLKAVSDESYKWSIEDM